MHWKMTKWIHLQSCSWKKLFTFLILIFVVTMLVALCVFFAQNRGNQNGKEEEGNETLRKQQVLDSSKGNNLLNTNMTRKELPQLSFKAQLAQIPSRTDGSSPPQHPPTTLETSETMSLPTQPQATSITTMTQTRTAQSTESSTPLSTNEITLTTNMDHSVMSTTMPSVSTQFTQTPPHINESAVAITTNTQNLPSSQETSTTMMSSTTEPQSISVSPSTPTESTESKVPTLSLTTNGLTESSNVDHSTTTHFETSTQLSPSSPSTLISAITETSPVQSTETMPSGSTPSQHPPTTLETSETMSLPTQPQATSITTMTQTRTAQSTESSTPLSTNEITLTTNMDHSVMSTTMSSVSTQFTQTPPHINESTVAITATTNEISSSTSQISSPTLSTSESVMSTKIISTNTVTTASHLTSSTHPFSNGTSSVTASFTTPQCTDCQCNGGNCIYNATLDKCHCVCQSFVFGNTCSFGENEAPAHIDTGRVPTRKANITLEIDIVFQPAYNDLSSPQSLNFIRKLEQELGALCKEADPYSYKTVKVIKLSPGSVVAESVAEYSYQNNETQIKFINTQLDGVLTGILNDTSNLKKISLAFGNQDVQLNGLTLQPPPITNITELKPFVDCFDYANYTAEISNGQWQCVGPCKTNPDYCHQHGECLNDINTGPTCRCYETPLEQFYGAQCNLFRRGPGFYGALFGSLATALLILIVIVIIVIVKKRHMGIWKDNFHSRRLSAFEEDFFDFSDRGIHNFGLIGTYRSTYPSRK